MRGLFLSLILFASPLFAQSDIQKAVFDCASGDMKFVASRIWLIEQSAKELTSKKVPYQFVLTVHSACTPLMDQESGEAAIETIQTRLHRLNHTYNVKIEACGIALERFGYEKEDLLPYVSTVRNSITRVIELQNNGYAFIPYH